MNAKDQYASDAVQFNRANQEFLNKINSDAIFKHDMLKGIQNYMHGLKIQT